MIIVNIIFLPSEYESFIEKGQIFQISDERCAEQWMQKSFVRVIVIAIVARLGRSWKKRTHGNFCQAKKSQ